MVESEARELSEEIMLGAVLFGHEQMQVAIQAIKELAAEVGRETVAFQPPEADTALTEAVESAVGEDMAASCGDKNVHMKRASGSNIRTRRCAADRWAAAGWPRSHIGRCRRFSGAIA